MRLTAADRRRLGAVMTPTSLADWVASELVAAARAAPRRVLDPAVGDGALLAAVGRLAPAAELVGVDVNPHVEAGLRRNVPRARVVIADALGAGPKGLGAPVDGLIANPPWGAAVGHSAAQLRAWGYATARGQFDSFDLFVELALGLLAPRGVAALILPDALLAPEHRAARRMLSHATLLTVARLGEGIFPGVQRGTMVVVVDRSVPRADHRVKVIRLGPDDRRAIAAGERQLGEVTGAAARWMPQRQLLGGEWRLDVTADDRASLQAFERHPTVWRHVETSRGVEISKHGRALLCPACGLAAPAPRGEALERACPHCGSAAPLARFRPLQIVGDGVPVRADEPATWVPLVAGEDVQRYVATPSRSLRLGVAGIVYKERSSRLRRLVVRKTGLGLNVAVLPPGVRTVQTVYEFWARGGGPALALEYYLLGVLGSRAMLAYHLKRSGEGEWRSHPYVTQKTVLGLPVPDPYASPAMLRLARVIADGARRLTERPRDHALDLAVEQLVWELVGLGSADAHWIANTLAGTQDQRAFTRMRLSAGG